MLWEAIHGYEHALNVAVYVRGYKSMFPVIQAQDGRVSLTNKELFFV